MKNKLLVEILRIHNRIQNQILLFGEASLPDNRYEAFRKLVIRAFGYGGAKDELLKLFEHETKSKS